MPTPPRAESLARTATTNMQVLTNTMKSHVHTKYNHTITSIYRTVRITTWEASPLDKIGDKMSDDVPEQKVSEAVGNSETAKTIFRFGKKVSQDSSPINKNE